MAELGTLLLVVVVATIVWFTTSWVFLCFSQRAKWIANGREDARRNLSWYPKKSIWPYFLWYRWARANEEQKMRKEALHG